jgi:alcohol dehydrogenase, propanol-preferring
MRAWVVDEPKPIDDGPLAFIDHVIPEPAEGEILVRVSVCGVCRTDLHLAEGDLAPHAPMITPGHEIVGTVEAAGRGSSRFALGERVGIAWLRHTCGECRFCWRGDENLCVAPLFTGWDAHGGYAEWAVVDERYAYSLPDRFDDETAAPLLCAGIIGYRALKRAGLPAGRNTRLGMYGFGASAHIAAQVAMARGATVHVMTRSQAARDLATALGVASVGDATAMPPEPLDAAIIFAPVGTLVPPALEAVDRGGIVCIAGIHLTDIPPLNYQSHLFQERELRSVTANTRTDGEEFLALAAEIPLRIETTPYDLANADAALRDLAADRVNGAAVLRVR